MSRFLWKVNAVLFLFPVLILSAGTWAQLPTKAEFIAICENNDHQHLRELFNHAGQDQVQAWINKPFDNGLTPLTLAFDYLYTYQSTQQHSSKSCCKDVIKLLSESGADVNDVCHYNGWSVLMAATSFGHIARIIGRAEKIDTEEDLSASEAVEREIQSTPFLNRQKRSKP